MICERVSKPQAAKLSSFFDIRGLITLEMGAANAGRQSLRGDSIISVSLTNSKN